MSTDASASCPAKLMACGEYAVLEGAPALMLALNRRARALFAPRSEAKLRGPFMHAAHDVLAFHFGPDCKAARVLHQVVVDTSSFSHEGKKLGLGSSAAATVSAMALALENEGEFDRKLVHSLSRQAHGDAQQKIGARGSGADIAACSFGGCTRFVASAKAGKESRTEPHPLPAGLHFAFPWLASPASTTGLVSKVKAWKRSEPHAYLQQMDGLQKASEELLDSHEAHSFVAAMSSAFRALATFGKACSLPLVLPQHVELQELATSLGGSCKPTGAGGGDLALAVFTDGVKCERFRRECEGRGILCPDLKLDPDGVRLEPPVE